MPNIRPKKCGLCLIIRPKKCNFAADIRPKKCDYGKKSVSKIIGLEEEYRS